MKNKFNIKQVADYYCLELGVEVPMMEEYLKAVFQNGRYEEYEAEIVLALRGEYDGKSEFFPDWK